MSESIEPRVGYGYIYVLSNPSMPNVFKIGLTTNSVKRRIQELNSTGVPKSFKAEKIFEVEECHLRTIESLAHKKLKEKDLHHGKEFFEGTLSDCIHCVQDSIYEITGSNSDDLIGKARERVEKEKLEKMARKREREAKDLKLKKANEDIEKLRQEYIYQQEIEENASTPLLDKFIWEPLGILLIGAIAIGIAMTTGPIGWIVCPIVIYYFYKKDKDDTKQRYENIAKARYPYRNLENINSYQSQNPISTPTPIKKPISTQINNSNSVALDGPTITCPACRRITKLYEKDRYQNCMICRHKFTNPFWKPERPLANTGIKDEIMWTKTPRGLRNKKTSEFIYFADTFRSVFPTPGYNLKFGGFIKDTEIELETLES